MKPTTLNLTLWLSALALSAASALDAAPPAAPAAKPAPITVPKPAPATAPTAATPAISTPNPTPNTQHPTPLSPVWSVAFSPDGLRVAVGVYRAVRVYDVATGKKLGEWKTGGDATRAVAFSADGKLLAAGGGVPGQSGVAWMLDALTGKVRRVVKNHGDTIEAVAFAGNTLLTAGDDERVGVTDALTGGGIGKLTEHNGRCLSVAVPGKISDEAGGDIWATGGSDNMLKIWDARVRRVVVNFDQCASPIWSLATQSNNPGHFIAGCGDGVVRYFAVRLDKDGKADEQGVLPRTGYLETAHAAHEGAVFALGVAPNQGFIVTGGADNKMCVWGVGGGLQKQFRDATAPIGGVAVAPDSKKIAAASLDGKCRIYDADKRTLLLTLGANGPEEPAALTTLADPRLVALLPKKPASGTGLTGRYWNGREPGAAPALVRVDPTIEFSYPRIAGQTTGIEASEFCVRWEGFFEAPTDGQYRVFTRTDDGVRFWVNGKSEVDQWVDQGPTELGSAPLTLKAGQRIPIRMEFFQGAGGGSATLLWEYTGQAKQVIPSAYLYPLPTPTKAAPKVPAPVKTPSAKSPAALRTGSIR